MIAIDVSDAGIGISRDRVPAVFSPFQQASTGLTRDHDGCGIGLAIVREWVDEIGGSIEVDTAPGEDTRITITLPRVVHPLDNG